MSKKNGKSGNIPAPRNFVAKHAKRSGAGSHSDSKYSRKEKHKGREPFLIATN